MRNKTDKVLVADDHPIVRQGVKDILQDNLNMHVVGEARTGREAIELARALRPDIVIIDISMPEINGIEAVLEIKKLLDKAIIVVYSMYSNREYVDLLLNAGIAAYILKEDSLTDLIHAIDLVKKGGVYLSKGVSDIVLKPREKRAENDFDILSGREREVLRLIAEGYTAHEIADRLCISTKTVESHKYNMFEKLNVKTIAGLTKIAIKKRLVSL
ncbi:MAG: response regulator transcription factor [Deltaproteobacteria bacterium]|nr:response regulator transcription factor [Deltaproteobacteria bacterium]